MSFMQIAVWLERLADRKIAENGTDSEENDDEGGAIPITRDTIALMPRLIRRDDPLKKTAERLSNLQNT